MLSGPGAGSVARGSRCPAPPRHTLLAESLAKPSLRVIIKDHWHNGVARADNQEIQGVNENAAQSESQENTGPARPKPPGGPGPVARLRNYFFAGVLVAAPIGITFLLTWKVIAFIDDSVTPLVPPVWNPETYLPFSVPGLGLVVAVVFLALAGFVATGIAGRAMVRLGERLVGNVPVARSIYSWTKQVFETVLSQQSTAFNEVVLIEYPSRGVWAVGFITGQTVGEVQQLTAETVYNVFIPATPNPTTGFLLFIPDRDIHRLDMTVEEGIKLVISGGIVQPPQHSAEERAAFIDGATAPRRQSDVEPVEESHGDKLGPVKRLRNYFFAGVLVTAPIGITIWIGWGLVSWVDDQVVPFIPARWNPESYLPFSLPGLGVLVAIFILVMIGFLTAGLVGRNLVGLGERLLDRMPVIRGVYGAVKQVLETVLKEQSKAFRQVILIQYPRQESWAIGFITGETEGNVQRGTPRDVINVFLPTTPNPTSGFLLFVPRDEIQDLTMTVEEGIKMVVSGGIVTPPTRAEAEDGDAGDPSEAKIAESA
jgi:uncharacterized membrane protein